MDSTEVSRPATMNVAECTSGSSAAARWPSRHAMVMPPAQIPSVLASVVPAMSHATPMASLQAST